MHIRRNRGIRGLLVVALCSMWSLVGCANRQAPAEPAAAEAPQTPTLKYVFLFIGDGMGPNQVKLAEKAAEAEGKSLLMSSLPIKGQLTTRSANNETTDSAAAATALACGIKTNNGMVGQLPDGQPVDSVAVKLAQAGWKVGVMSSVQLNHATPAGFYGHVPARNKYNEIAEQFPASGIHFIAGRGMNSQDNSQERIFAQWEQTGIAVTRDLEAARSVPTDSRLAFVSNALSDPDSAELQLADVVKLAIDRLHQPGQGMFLMVEGGAIDWGGHSNNGWQNARESLAFDRAIAVAYEFYEKYPQETLIVITADHETGGLSLDLDRIDIAKVREAVEKRDQIIKALGEDPEQVDMAKVQQVAFTTLELGFVTESEQAQFKKAVESEASKRIGNVASAIQRVAQARAGVRWSTGGHTKVDVPVFAVGAGAERFEGGFDNTQIPLRILELCGIAAPATAE